MQNNSAESSPVHALTPAPAWKRILAWLIDISLLTLLMAIALQIFLGKELQSLSLGDSAEVNLKILQSFYSRYGNQLFWGNVLLQLSYFTTFWSGTGQTLGAKFLKIGVIQTDLFRLSLPRSFLRAALLYLSSVALYVPLIFVWEPVLQQRIHDFVSGSVVIDLSQEESEDEDELSESVDKG